jgi:hypothetical protein
MSAAENALGVLGIAFKPRAHFRWRRAARKKSGQMRDASAPPPRVPRR